MALLSVRETNCYYGAAHVLFDLTLEVERGEVVALLGRNGAGKSTTLKCILGLVPPQGGSIEFAGRRIDGRPPHVIARLGMGYAPEDRRIFTDLTVTENLEVGRQPPREGSPVWTVERLFELFPNLGQMRQRLGRQMSGGEQQMLSIARALMGNPLMVLLDEPSEGLAPIIVEQMARMIKALKGEGLTVMLSEQNLHFANAVGDRAYIIEKGRICYRGTMQALASNETVRRTYLTL